MTVAMQPRPSGQRPPRAAKPHSARPDCADSTEVKSCVSIGIHTFSPQDLFWPWPHA